MLKLYQFPISHYCEKVRWALEHKQLDYKKINLLPGLHIKKAKTLTGKPHLPILTDKDIVLDESRKIIDYLDITYPNNSLTPKDEALKAQALKWEKFADHELGHDVRSLCYYTLLDHPDITIPFFATNGPWYSTLLLKYSFPKMSIKMRELMQLNEENHAIIKQRLTKTLDILYQHTQNNTYLVGNQFTRADLAVSALLAPLCRPKKYGLKWPDQYPEPLHNTINEFSQYLNWVDHIYKKHR